MTRLTPVSPGQILTGPVFNEPMRVETVLANGPASWVVGLVGTQSERFRKVTLTADDIERLTILDTEHSFDGDGRLLRLGLQAYALGIAYEFDPYFGLSISRVDPLPHQLEAVCDYLLRRALGGDGKPACLPLHFHEMQGLQADRGLLDYSALTVPDARWDDLDPLEFDRFRRFIRESQGRGDASLVDLPHAELAKALGAIQANHAVSSVRALGLLLFGREESLRRLLPVHEAAFQVLRGLEVRVNDFFRWPLLRVMDELLGRFRAYNREEELLVGMLRVGVPDYPPAAFREGVANALIHRDYTRLGAVHAQWHDDRIEISNPGGFRKACGWTTCPSPNCGRATPCWPTPSSAPASSSARHAASTPSSSSNSATADRHRATPAATRPGLCLCFRAAGPTSTLRAWLRKKARHNARSGLTTCSC